MSPCRSRWVWASMSPGRTVIWLRSITRAFGACPWIWAVGPLAQIQGQAPNARVIDLSQMTVLPGLIDAHTHLLLQGDITSQEYEDQLLKQSTPYRAILAARNARIALEHGFTAIRDLETEGAMY